MSSKLALVRPPERFTGLHSHSSFSVFDGLGYPEAHIKFVTSDTQGMDSWALTDHGNGSGLAHARSAALKTQKSGKKYRQLYGVEFYFVPSLEDWQRSMDAHHQSIKDAKTAKQAQARAEEPLVIKPPDEEEEQGGHIVENEEETKESKPGKPEWKKYYHLVIVAKNRVGLGNLFTLVKKSFKHGFYRFPRIDYKMLKEHGEGLVVSTACIGGLASGLIYSEFPDLKFSELHPDLLTDPVKSAAIGGRLDNMVGRFVDCVGRDNFFLEVQFNELGAQHLTNAALIEASIRNGIPLIATADSHFPSPDKWQARELYKKLGWMGAKLDKTMLPKLEDMKTMLYPKNATQMWDEFKKGYEQHEFYQGHEELMRDAIERTHDIAWQKCEDTWIDTKAKLPHLDTPKETAFDQLMRLVKEGLVREGLDKNDVYVDRARKELSDIKFLGHASYFVTMYHIFHRAEEKTLLGPGRGSGPSSLVNFLLGITQFDPIQYNLLWGRFLNRQKAGWPDIDCLKSSHFVNTPEGHRVISSLKTGDVVYDINNQARKILYSSLRNADANDIIYDIYVQHEDGTAGVIVANHKHRLLTSSRKEIHVSDIQPGDLLLGTDRPILVIKKSLHPQDNIEIFDITVEESSTFWVIPFDVIEFTKNNEKILGSIYTYNLDADAAEEVLAYVQQGIAQ